MAANFQLIFDFKRTYETKLLQSAPPVHPLEKLYHYPVELEEGDRAGAYVRVDPRGKIPWTGFFALGFDSDNAVNAICSCPDPDSFCAIVGGYAYVVRAPDPEKWFRVEQRPVTALRILAGQKLILFAGFTSITALGSSGIRWTTERLSWEGISITEISGNRLRGLAWDAISDEEVDFEVDLLTGKHTGGARPQDNSISRSV
ncbi:MAG TPA: hypothetical protein VKW06_04885 [Candidatus Angelobacter sp.]|nr:hypothetical protein [Candidatus Angelobacter sp.]